MWHRSPYVVEDGGGIGPEASHRFDCRFVTGKRSLTAHELIVGLTSTLFAMAGKAFRCVYGLSLLGSAAARRQTDAVGANADVPSGDFVRRYHATEIRTISRKYQARYQSEPGSCQSKSATHKHA